MATLTVYACESQPIVLEGLQRVLDGCPDLCLVGYSGAAIEALPAIRETSPNLVLIDDSAGLKTTLQFIAEIRARSPKSHTILWGGELVEVDCFRALQMGARGILKKSLPVAALIECLRAVGAGNIWIEHAVSTQVVDFLNRPNAPRLTPREKEILALICRGLRNKQIAAELSITPGTVKVHLMHLFEKVGVKDRFELALQGRKLLGVDVEETAVPALLPAVAEG